ncbi:MAG: DUF2157 domain-containing protein, partial [Verrucomicrobiota bacterium]
MPDPPAWITWLRNETAAWVKDGLIDESQREKIVERYPIPEGPPPLPKKEAKNRLPVVLIGLAVLLIGVGLLLFYASNWKRMTPPVKLIQVFTLLVVTNGAAFYFLFKKSAWTEAGRGLLMLALLVFGAAIGLVAQTYHISAHPTTGILIWSLAAFAMAGVVRERWAFYLGLLLLLIWDTWERTIFDNPNYAMLPALAVIYALSIWIRSEIGRFAAVILGILWFYEVNFHHLVDPDFSDAWPIFILSQIPLGALLIGLALTMQKAIGAAMATMLRILGWIIIYSPLLILAWPIDFDVAFTWQLEGSTPFLIQFGFLTISAGAVTLFLKRQGSSTWSILVIAVAAGVALTCAYLDSPAAYMTIMLLALTLFHGVTLYAGSKIGLPGSSVMALILAVVSIAVRCIGHLFLSGGESEHLVSAALSGLFFVAVIYFISELVRARSVDDSGIIYQVLSAICIVVSYIIIYGASFSSGDSNGFIPEKWGVPNLVLVALAIGFWLYLFFGKISNQRGMIAAGVVMVISLVCMTASSEVVVPELRQLLLNILLFFIAGSMIIFAVSRNSSALVNICVAAIVIHVMTRYFDVFWDMLHGSVFFIVT